MQLSDMIADVRARIQESVASTWTDAQITGWLNRALDDLSEIAMYEKTYTTSSVANQNAYALPTDCLRDGVRSFTWTVPQGTSVAAIVPVRYIQRKEYDRLQMFGAGVQQSGPLSFPPVYTIWGGNAYVLPVPLESGTNDLEFYYYATLPYLVNSTDTPAPAIPQNRHEVLVFYATARCYEMIGESNYYAEYMQQYETGKALLEQEMSNNQRDMPRFVQDVSGGWW